MFSDSQSLIASSKNRIYRGTAVAHIATKYYLAEDMARDGEIDLSHVPTAEMLAECFTKSLPKPAFLKQCAAVGMIAIGHGNGLGIGIGNNLGNGPVQSEMVSGIVWEMLSEREKPLGMPSECKLIHWARLFRGDPRCLIGSSYVLFTVLFETDVKAVLEKC